MNALNAVDLFIYEHGHILYITFLILSLVCLGFILASGTLRAHPPLEPSPTHSRPPRLAPPKLKASSGPAGTGKRDSVSL